MMLSISEPWALSVTEEIDLLVIAKTDYVELWTRMELEAAQLWKLRL